MKSNKHSNLLFIYRLQNMRIFWRDQNNLLRQKINVCWFRNINWPCLLFMIIHTVIFLSLQIKMVICRCFIISPLASSNHRNCKWFAVLFLLFLFLLLWIVGFGLNQFLEHQQKTFQEIDEFDKLKYILAKRTKYVLFYIHVSSDRSFI